jgi:hypothetical protein
MRLEAAALAPGAHGAPQLVRFAGVKSAAAIAICMTCSWNRGMPKRAFGCCADFVAGILDRFLAGAPAQVGVDHAALDRAWPDDRHLDDQVIEACAAAAAAACSSARGSRSGRRPRCRRLADHFVGGRVLGRHVLHAHGRPPALRADQVQRSMDGRQHAQGQDVDLDEAQGESRSSLSHWMMLRFSIAAFSTGTSRLSLSRAITKPPVCWLRWRGKAADRVGERDPLRNEHLAACGRFRFPRGTPR